MFQPRIGKWTTWFFEAIGEFSDGDPVRLREVVGFSLFASGGLDHAVNIEDFGSAEGLGALFDWISELVLNRQFEEVFVIGGLVGYMDYLFERIAEDSAAGTKLGRELVDKLKESMQDPDQAQAFADHLRADGI